MPEPAVKGLDEAARAGGGRRRPPVEDWCPAVAGPIDIRIAGDGSWSYQGSPIRRAALVRLFASILRREADGGFALVTPVEKRFITVEDAPFVAVAMEVTGAGEAQVIGFETNVGDRVAAGEAHPLRFAAVGDDGTVKPYVTVRRGLEALIARPVFYDLCELGDARRHDGAEWFGVWSGGRFWPMLPAAAMEG